jgi:hypothetical protein
MSSWKISYSVSNCEADEQLQLVGSKMRKTPYGNQWRSLLIFYLAADGFVMSQRDDGLQEELDRVERSDFKFLN